jgi:soluble lytic murein transglycosylase-like protein
VYFKFITAIALCSSLYGTTAVSVSPATVFDEASKRYKIDKKILASVAFQESDFEPTVIGVNTKNVKRRGILKDCLDVIEIKYKIKGDRAVIYVGDNESANLVFLVLNRLKMDYDVGIMQINQWNIKKRNLNANRLLSDVRYNIHFGAKILHECQRKYKDDLESMFECYNKGYDSRKYNNSYSNKVLLKYKKLFM